MARIALYSVQPINHLTSSNETLIALFSLFFMEQSDV